MKREEIINLIEGSPNIRVLVGNLNYVYIRQKFYYRTDASVDEVIQRKSYTIPVFSTREPKDMRDVYSYDDEWLVKFDGFIFHFSQRED